MLKQPLLSRMFKLSGSALSSDKTPDDQTPDDQTAIEKQSSAEQSDHKQSSHKQSDGERTNSEQSGSEQSGSAQTKLALEKTLREKTSKEKTSKEKTSEDKTSKQKTLEDKTLEDKTLDQPAALSSEASTAEKIPASETAKDKASEKQLSEHVAVEANAEEPNATKPASKRKKLSKKSILKLVAAFGLLATGSGFAVARTSPETLRTVLPAADKPLPLSLSGDPTAEPVMRAGDLFLTNQILYRKLEAIAGVSLTAPVQPNSPAASASTTAAKPTAVAKPNKNSSAANTSTDSKPAKTEKADTEKPSEAAKPDPDVNVVAAAPPAPPIAPVDFSGTTIDSVLEMRVAVAKDVPAIGFATSNSGVITDLDGNTLKELSAEQGVMAAISGGIVVEGENMPSAFWVYPEDGGYVAVGDSWYRGRVLIALRERGLIAVNHVLLGDYLYSVVGTEMSATWPIESLKAQAIAARSYALTHNIHPASEDYFDLDNTERFQAYKGLSREANTTQAAVKATAGEFISHEGGIVESLYAASQAIVDDAHKGSGMSQLGAKDLAEQGYSYQEILAHYYPGTALGRLETDQE